MSSFSTAYVVAPTRIINTSPYIPEETQLNDTGAVVDLIPQIIYSGAPSYFPLSNTPGSTTIIFTDITLRGAGTYLVTVNYSILGNFLVPWVNSETMVLDVCTTDTENVVAIPNVTLQPAYVNNFTSFSNDDIIVSLKGNIELTGPAFLNARVTRYGSLSANRQGGLYSMSVQKIA
jgi:hypothetical protein